MKRIVSVALALVMLATLCLSVSANESTDYTYEYGLKTIVFESDTPFTEAECRHIAEHLAYGDDGVSARGFNILCLFGHKYTVGYTTVITHCVNSTAPRCKEEYCEVGTCSRCGDIYTKVLTFQYINCCP